MSSMPMKQDDHPSHNMPTATQHYAGDVVPIRPDSSSDSSTADRQKSNERSMDDIATRGPSAVDTNNLAVFKPRN